MIKFLRVTKKFGKTVALRSVSFEVKRGEFLSLVGPTGSGKTTIFRLLRREILPTRGKIFFEGKDLARLPPSQTALLRRKIGVIFQDYKLLEEMTVFENVALSLEVMNVEKKEIEKKVKEVLKKMGIWEKRDFFPAQLSGGEIQRTAVARAIVSSPEIILADEPTADLDPLTTWEIISFLDELNRKEKTTIILATHDFDIVDTLKRRVITLEEGRIISDVAKGKYND